MTTPTVRATGALAHGLGDTLVTLPTHAVGDLLVMWAACDTDTIAAPAGWTIQASMFVSGSSLAFMTRDAYAASTSESNPTILDPGNHVCAVAQSINGGDVAVHRIGGCSTQGSQTIARTQRFKTSLDEALILFGIQSALDSLGPIASAPTNADVASLTEIFDEGTDDGNGSVIVVHSATKNSPGMIRPFECTVTAGNTVGIAVAIIPKAAVTYSGVASRHASAGGGFVPNGTTVRVKDMTQDDVVFTTTVGGGSGAFSLPVRYSGHTYEATCQDTTNRGASDLAVP